MRDSLPGQTAAHRSSSLLFLLRKTNPGNKYGHNFLSGRSPLLLVFLSRNCSSRRPSSPFFTSYFEQLRNEASRRALRAECSSILSFLAS